MNKKYKAWLIAGTAIFIVMYAATVFVSASKYAEPFVNRISLVPYDTAFEKTRTMTGKLVRFAPGQRYSEYLFEVLADDGTVEKDEEGKPVNWIVRTADSASQLSQRGITAASFRPGTIARVSFSPLRDGRNGGAQNGPLILCGRQLPENGCNEKTGLRIPD